MKNTENRLKFDRGDLLVALGIAVLALVCYVRTLAPDILYSDSGEFQALSYTLGIAHTTGYPVYLLLGKLFGTLAPVGTFAYRINLLSAIYAAGTLSGLYLLVRGFTRSRIGPALGCLVLGLSYTFWSQAVIAEIYTLATLALVWSMFCLWRWQEDPARRGIWLLFALLLLGLGIHTVVELVAPAVGILIIWTLWSKHLPARQWGRSIGMAAAGGAIGAAIFFLAFYLNDTLLNPPASFLNVTLVPSRSLWGATAADLDSFIKRLYHTVVPLQWGKDLFSGDPAFMWKELGKYLDTLVQHDFSWIPVACAALGLIVALIRRTRMAVFMLLAYLTLLFYIINYKVENKFVFYLATYAFVAGMSGVGTGFVLEKIRGFLAGRGWRWFHQAVYALPVLILAALFLAPSAGSRWQALQAGRATFFTDDDYTFPVKNLAEPRAAAGAVLQLVPDNAMLLMEWRTLYATVYLANAEQNRPGILFREASPYPSKNKLPDSLLAEVKTELNAGRPVYAERMFDNLRDNFNLKSVPGSRMLQLQLK